MFEHGLLKVIQKTAKFVKVVPLSHFLDHVLIHVKREVLLRLTRLLDELRQNLRVFKSALCKLG